MYIFFELFKSKMVMKFFIMYLWIFIYIFFCIVYNCIVFRFIKDEVIDSKFIFKNLFDFKSIFNC